MTIEEIDIIVNVVVERAIREFKKIVPEIKRSMKNVTEQINKPDLKGFAGKIQRAIKQGKQRLEDFKKSNENNKIAINVTTKEAEKEISQLQKQVNSLEEKINARQIKLNITNDTLDKMRANTNQQVINEMPDAGNKTIKQETYNRLEKDNSYMLLVKESDKLNSEIIKYNSLLESAKSKMSQLGQQVSQTATTQNRLGSFFSGFKGKIDQAKSSLGSVKNTFNKMPNIAQNMSKITAKVQNNIKGMGKGLKQGLGHVLKYASALFSLRGIYSILSSSAQSWLSSQNEQAKQLSSNIEYMKYAMGSAFAPVIQYVTNLVYKLMKAIQTVIYSLFKVNIFANASASSYASMANNAKKTAKETKTLANIDEINNIGGNDNDSSNVNGTTTPSFDLSNVDTSLKDWYENLDFYELGRNVAKKINNALSNIDWTEIQTGAKTIATNIGDYINGFVDGLNWNLLGSIIGNGINTALVFANTLFTTVNFEKIGNSIATFLNGAIKTTKWDLLGTTIANGINIGIDTAYGFVTKFEWGEFGTAIGTSINNMFKNIKWDKAGQALGEGIKGVFNSISNFLNEVDWQQVGKSIADFITNIDWLGVAKAIVKAIASAISAVEGIGEGLAQGLIKAIVKDITGVELTDEQLKGITNKIKDFFYQGFKNALSNLSGPLGTLFENLGIIDLLKSIGTDGGEGMIDNMKTSIENAKKSVVSTWDNVKTWFTDIKKNASVVITQKWEDIKRKWESITKNIKDKAADMKAKIGTKWSDIKQKWYNITSKISNKTADMKAKIGNKWSDIKQKWYNITSKISNKTANMKAKIGTKWSDIKQAWNNLMDKFQDKVINVKVQISTIIDNVKEWLNTHFIDKVNSHIPNWIGQIPRLATGNVATKETLAIFGEYSNARTNPEITAPQSTIYETMVQALNDSNFNRGNSNSEFKTLIFKFGSYRVAFELEELRRKAQRQNGTATVTI